MCIWAVLGIGPEGVLECFGHGWQNRPAAALHHVLPAGQSGEEIADPFLHIDLVPQAQVSRHLLSRPAPDRLVSVEVRAVTRQAHQPQPQVGRPQVLPHCLTAMHWRVVPDHIQRPGVPLAQSAQEGRGCSGVAVFFQLHPLPLPGLQTHFRVVAGLFAIARAGRVHQSLPSPQDPLVP